MHSAGVSGQCLASICQRRARQRERRHYQFSPNEKTGTSWLGQCMCATTADQSTLSFLLHLSHSASTAGNHLCLRPLCCPLLLMLLFTLICILLSARVYELIKAKILKFSLFFARSRFSCFSSLFFLLYFEGSRFRTSLPSKCS